MDKASILQSGMLELYVAGALSAEEIQELEAAIALYPELQAEIALISEAVEQFAAKQSVKPPTKLRASVVDAVSALAVSEQPAKVIPLQSGMSWKRYSLVASIGIGLGLLPSIWLYQELRQTEQSLLENQKALAASRVEQSVIASKASYLQKTIGEISDTNVVRIPLGNVSKENVYFAAVYWNKASNRVVLDASQMPAAPTDKDYQLWAIVDGKPVSMGVFNPENMASTIAEMQNAIAPQAFAVTIEPKGGNSAPTLTAMVVLGKV
jgi:anti-sigma-K factor RskA